MGKFSKYSADDYFGDDEELPAAESQEASSYWQATGTDDAASALPSMPSFGSSASVSTTFAPPAPTPRDLQHSWEPADKAEDATHSDFGASVTPIGYAERDAIEPLPAKHKRKFPTKIVAIVGSVTVVTALVAFGFYHTVSTSNERIDKLNNALAAAKTDAENTKTELDKSESQIKTLNAKISDQGAELKASEACVDGYKALLTDYANGDQQAYMDDLAKMDDSCFPSE